MIFLAHAAYPALLFAIFAKFSSTTYSLFDFLILIFFSILPDLDFLFYKIFKKGKYDSDFQHHQWPSHWPIIYLPLFILLILFPNLKLFLICYGLLSHFIMDTFLSGDGIMWLYPFSKRFFSLCDKKTKGCHGIKWFKLYKKKTIYKIDLLGFVALLFLLYYLIKNISL